MVVASVPAVGDLASTPTHTHAQHTIMHPCDNQSGIVRTRYAYQITIRSFIVFLSGKPMSCSVWEKRHFRLVYIPKRIIQFESESCDAAICLPLSLCAAAEALSWFGGLFGSCQRQVWARPQAAASFTFPTCQGNWTWPVQGSGSYGWKWSKTIEKKHINLTCFHIFFYGTKMEI